ncbi:MAG TPA: hypothetical protein VHE77_07810 [Dongiaceae bacterium]|jgi:hypothetical protein|nr:hypothetical protein [Dongiaceae bacterium]
MSKKKSAEATIKPAGTLPALPAKRARRRSVRASHSWCWRRPPSRKRVETAQGRSLPEHVLAPAIMPEHAFQI